jgi:pSer/pThr/pTyr-binding forkhead associated (FHA) protein
VGSGLKRAILEVRWGPMASQRTVIQPGTTLRVGRTDRADLVLPHDEEMSGLHMELTWDGATCLVRDLKSAKGTQLDGVRVESGSVAHGGWIRAGTTNFSLYYEAHTPPRRDAVDMSPEGQAKAQEVLSALQREAQGRALFALLDAAQGDRVMELLRESVEAYTCLFEGTRGAVMEEAAPYLVELPEASALLERLVQEGWGKSWGVYLVSRRPLAEIRRHFRKILFVKEEDSRRDMYFRFYDPRVLRAFLPSCTARQTEEMFGDIETFLIEGEEGDVFKFTRGEVSAD